MRFCFPHANLLQSPKTVNKTTKRHITTILLTKWRYQRQMKCLEALLTQGPLGNANQQGQTTKMASLVKDACLCCKGMQGIDMGY